MIRFGGIGPYANPLLAVARTNALVTQVSDFPPFRTTAAATRGLPPDDGDGSGRLRTAEPDHKFENGS